MIFKKRLNVTHSAITWSPSITIMYLDLLREVMKLIVANLHSNDVQCHLEGED